MNTESAGTPSNLIVETRQGLIEGFEEDGVKKFFGIPFAQPPVGDLRWRQPVYPADSWSGVRSVKDFSAAPYQTISVPMPLRSNGISEDCLYLNVWTQTTDPNAKQPVLVWFFGGGNLRGAGSLAHVDGSELAKLGATVVNPNYRVGCFGFLNDEKMGANFAVGDQIAVLRWVHDNIEALGGDPERVMIFGNSAGAVSVRSLLDAPAARGLFQRAFMQSAGFDDPANGHGWSFERSRAATQKLWAALGTDDPERLRAIPAEQIGAAAHPLSGIFPAKDHVHTPLNLVWMPTVDGDVVTGDEEGWAENVPLMVGVTEHEARWSLSPTEHYNAQVLKNMAIYFAGDRADEVLAILDRGGGNVFEKLDRLYTVGVWTEPAFAMMKRYAAQGRTIYYVHFARSGPEAVVTNRLASHGAPVPYLFRTMPDDGTYDDVDLRISSEMMHALIEFAKSGVPVSTGGNVWPSFDPARPRETLISESISAATYKVTPLLRALNGLRGSDGMEGADRTATSASRNLFTGSYDGGAEQCVDAADGVRICFETTGDGSPTIVLIHGGLCDRSFWASQIDVLAQNHRVVAVDLPGHGGSGAERTQWSIEGLADDVCRVIASCGAEQVITVGHSVGALVALEAARMLGDRATGLVIVDMLHDPDAPLRVPPQNLDREAMIAGMRKGMFTEHSDPTTADRIITSMTSKAPAVAQSLSAAMEKYDAAAALSSVGALPITMILSRLRRVNPSAIRMINPATKIYVVPDAGHFLMIEAPKTFNTLLEYAVVEATGQVEEC